MTDKKPVGRPRVFQNRTSTSIQLEVNILNEIKVEAKKQNISIGVLICQLWEKNKPAI